MAKEKCDINIVWGNVCYAFLDLRFCHCLVNTNEFLKKKKDMAALTVHLSVTINGIWEKLMYRSLLKIMYKCTCHVWDVVGEFLLTWWRKSQKRHRISFLKLSENTAYSKCFHVVRAGFFTCLLLAPCGSGGCNNRPTPFPGWISYKATKPGLVLFYILACFNCIVAY